MDRETFLGGSIFGVVIRLAVLSIVVGMVLTALHITPESFVRRMIELLQAVYNLGLDAVRSVFEYFVVGAVVVVPIWLIARILKTARSHKETP
jgi:hypothetical protein